MAKPPFHRTALACWLVILLGPCAQATPLALPFCHNRYAPAAQMLDAAYGKYGTLYSGGDVWHHLDDVGATIDLYRLWHGLPDLQFRGLRVEPDRHTDQIFNRDLTKTVQRVMPEALAAVHTASPAPLSGDAKFTTAIALDLASSLGPTPDWWLAPQPDPTLTPQQLWARDQAQQDPFLDWLHTVLAGSNAPWAYG